MRKTEEPITTGRNLFYKYICVLKSVSVAIPKMNGSNPEHSISLMKHILSGGKYPLPERTVFWELTG
jgi:hypothetical protein